MRNEINRQIDVVESKLQRQINEIDGQVARAEMKLDKVETFDKTKTLVDENIEEVKQEI